MSPISVCGFDLTVSKAQSCLGEFHPHSRSGQGRKGMKRSNVCAAACPLLKAFLEVLPMIYAWLSLTQLRHIFVKEAKKYSYLVDPLVPQTKVGFTWREKRGINNGKAVSSMLWMHCFIAYCFCVQTPQDIVLKRWKKKPVYTSSLFRQCCCPKSPSSNRRPHHSRIPLQNWTAVLFPFLILPPKSQIKVMEELDTVGHEGTKLEVRRKERNPCSAQALRQACHTFISRKHDCHSWDRSHCPLTKAKTSSHSSPSNLTEFRHPKHEPRTLRLQSSSYIIKQTWACSC